jgi:hypothetical protein
MDLTQYVELLPHHYRWIFDWILIENLVALKTKIREYIISLHDIIQEEREIFLTVRLKETY